MKKIVIGMVADFQRDSGVTRFLQNSYMQLNDSDVKFVAINISGNYELDDDLNKLGWQVEHVTPANKSYRRHVRDWYNLLKRRDDFSVVYFNYSAAWNVIPLFLVKQLTNAKIAVHAHNVYFGSKSGRLKMKIILLLHKIGKLFNHGLVSYRYSASDAASRWLFLNSELQDVSVINNGVDLNSLDFSVKVRNRIRRKYDVADSCLVIGNVGVLEPRKNQAFLLKIFKSVVEVNSNAELWIFGDGSLRSELLSLATKLNINSKVRFWGRRDDLYSFYQGMDVFVMPSTSEGLSVAFIESQAAGLPVVINANLPQGNTVQGLVKSVDLDDTPLVWAQTILSTHQIVRRSTKEDLRQNGYDRLDLKRRAEEVVSLFRKDLYEQI